MPEPDQPMAAICRTCGARISLADFRSDGFLRGRRESDGGPYYELACSRCATWLQLRWEPDGSRVVEPRPRAGFFGHPSRFPAEEVQRFSREAAEERAGRRPDPDPGPTSKAGSTPEAEREQDSEPLPELEPGESIVRMREILGVDESAGSASVLAAFREQSKRTHPDRFTDFDRDFQALAHRKFIELKRARDCLLAIIEGREL